MKRRQIIMDKPSYLGLSILEMIKTVVSEFWYDYMKLKYGENSKWCYMDIFIVYMKQETLT